MIQIEVNPDSGQPEIVVHPGSLSAMAVRLGTLLGRKPVPRLVRACAAAEVVCQCRLSSREVAMLVSMYEVFSVDLGDDEEPPAAGAAACVDPTPPPVIEKATVLKSKGKGKPAEKSLAV